MMSKILKTLLKFSVLALLITTPAQALDDWQPLPAVEITRIAFGSCAQQWQPQSIWNKVAEASPDLFLFVGDAIYGDWHGDKPFTPTRKSLEADWNKLASIPEFESIRKQVPFMATWDNHDYGSHNGGAEFELKEMTKDVFLNFFGEPDDSQRRSTPGIYDAKVFGPPGKRVQVILLDTRWFRSPFKADPRSAEQRKAIGKVGKYVPNTDKSASVLGEAQWLWLAEQLQQQAELRLIVSSTQIIPDQKSMDEWGAFPHERQRLFDLIKSYGANGVLLVSGNVHFSELSKIDAGNYPLYDFTASGMTHVNPAYAAAPNRYRVDAPYLGQNVGLIEIFWNKMPEPLIRLSTLGIEEQKGLYFEISLGNLK